MDKKGDLVHLIRKTEEKSDWMYLFFPVRFLHYYLPHRKPHTECNLSQKSKSLIRSSSLCSEGEAATVCSQMIRY